MSSRARLYELSKDSAKVLERYQEIIKDYQTTKMKYRDPDFYPTMEVQACDARILSGAKWRRAENKWTGGILKNVKEADICQGKLSDCYLISALCHISRSPAAVRRLFVGPIDIGSGCVCVRFQIFEKPVYVIVDTLVPFVDNHPHFAHPRTDDASFWFAMVEKAYCKALGSIRAVRGGSSITAMYEMLGYTGYSTKVAELGNVSPSEQIEKYLKQTELVYASIARNDEAVEKGLTEDHTYAVYGVDTLGRNKVIHIRDPHGESNWSGDFSPDSPCWEIGYKKEVGFKQGGHIWINESDFGAFFESISCSVPLQRGWTMQTVETDVEKGSVDDGRTAFMHGPFVGSLKQWLVKFKRPCKVKVLFEEISGSNHSHSVLMQQNDKMKISQTEGEDYFIVKTSDETINEEWDIQDVSMPYTLVISRPHFTDKNDGHYYLRLEAPEPFEIQDLPEPDYEHMCSAKIEGTLKSGETDDRYPSGDRTVACVRQWRLKMEKPDTVFLRFKKDKTKSKHTVFLGHAMEDGKLKKRLKEYFTLTKKIHQNSTLEEWNWKVTDLSRPIVFGVCRDKQSTDSDFELELYSKTQFEIEPIKEAEDLEEPNREEIEGTLQPGWVDDRSPYGSIEGLSPLQQFRVDVKESGRIYLILRHNGHSKHMIALQKTHKSIDHFGIGDDAYFDTAQNYDKFYWDATPGEWALCVHREVSKHESNYKLELISDIDFSVEEIPMPDFEKLHKQTVSVKLGPGCAIGNADGISPYKQDLTPLTQWRVVNPVPQFIYGVIKRVKGPDVPVCVYMQKCDGNKAKCSYMGVPDHFYKVKCNSRSEAFKFDVGKIEGPWTLCITRTKKHSSHSKVELTLYSEFPLRITQIDDNIDEGSSDDEENSGNEIYPAKDREEDEKFMNKEGSDEELIEERQEEFLKREKNYQKWREQDELWLKEHAMKVKAAAKKEEFVVKGSGTIKESGVILAKQYTLVTYSPGELLISCTKDNQNDDVSVFLAKTEGNRRVDSFIPEAKCDIKPGNSAGELRFNITDNTVPYILGFMKNSGDDEVDFNYSVKAPNTIICDEAEDFDDIPVREIKGKLTSKTDGASPYGSCESLSGLQQWLLTIEEEGKVFFNFKHEGGVHTIALQKTNTLISKFVSRKEDVLFEVEENEKIFTWDATPGTWALCVYREKQMTASDWKLGISTHAAFDVQDLATETDNLKKDKLKSEVACNVPIFKNDLSCLNQWHVAIPGNQGNVIVKIVRKNDAKCDVIFFMQQRNGRRIKSSLKNSKEEIHVLTSQSKEETFILSAEEAAVWTCVLTGINVKEDQEPKISVKFFSNNGVLVSEFEEESYTEEMKERDNKFIEEHSE